jgi:hypothetical protein
MLQACVRTAAAGKPAFSGCKGRAASRSGPLPLALDLGTPKAANAESVKLQGQLVRMDNIGDDWHDFMIHTLHRFYVDAYSFMGSSWGLSGPTNVHNMICFSSICLGKEKDMLFFVLTSKPSY